MDSSTLDRSSAQAGAKSVPPESNSLLRTAPAPEGVRFPAEDAGKSLSEMARRDLDAALQLLTERAQYITGATGAAIALRRNGDMICQASAGPSAPALGSQLQVNSGLSAESVRTGRILRCDNAEMDARVNRESCRSLGIVSVVVLPLVAEEGVHGVFELFSDRAYAFSERDITALERLAEMIQTALQHAAAAERAEKIVGQDATNRQGQTENEDDARARSSPQESVAERTVELKLEPKVAGKNADGSDEHKPEKLESDEHKADDPAAVLTADRGNIGSCQSCGFPVSGGRKLCLDCESSGTSAGTAVPAFLSSVEVSREGWLRSHQYLIGTLLITGLTIAVLIWLR